MKQNKFIAFFILCFLILTSCEDFLNQQPTDQKTMEMVWKSRRETEAYLYNVYAKLPDETQLWNGAPWVAISDEADMTWDKYYSSNMNMGDWNPTSGYYNKWGDYYKSIRASFVFENNVDNCPELSNALKKQYKAEVKFLRGNYYWLLLRQYGPFVLIDHETETDEAWANYARTPFDQCVKYIVKMMDEAEEGLPWEWVTDKTWLGKPTKLSCKAIKAETLMLAASPQWNGNAEYGSFKNLDGTPLANITYDVQKWKDAAAASWDLIKSIEEQPNLNVKLYYNNENGDAVFNPYKSVRDAMLVKWNCEIIWARTGGDVLGFEKHATPRPGGWGGVGVTQRLVDAFYMVNGRTIDDPAAGYTETGFATVAHPNWQENKISIRTGDHWGHRKGEWNMYANREARFYMNVLYNKKPIPQANDNDRDGYSSSANKDGWGRVELYNTGVSGKAGSLDHPKTGYLALKRVDPSSNPIRDIFAAWRPTTYIRLAQVYLNYIEALNEYDPTNTHIKEYWDKIRNRAGLPSIFVTYPGIAGKTDEQLKYIIRERQVELCFEGDRYFTTRRRLISHTTDTQNPPEKRMFGDGGELYGMNIGVGSSFNDVTFYTRKAFETRVFNKKFYLFPIPQSEINKAEKIVQNPWW